MVHNETDCAFEGQCSKDGEFASIIVHPLRYFIIEGASYFLESKAAINHFLKEIEIAELYGLDFYILEKHLNCAIYNLEHASRIYENLINTAKTIPYDLGIIDKLKNFNYTEFQNNFNLNPSIFIDVENLLKDGNVIGVYEKTDIDIKDILDKLYYVKSTLMGKKSPDISTLWKINQSYNYINLFGQYVSQIFLNL
jgi:hypothetical protein